MKTTLILLITTTLVKSKEIDPDATHYDYDQGTGRITDNYHYLHFSINTTTLRYTYNRILSSYTILSFRQELQESNLLKQAAILCGELHQNLQQIMPQDRRMKRGLIDGLGTAIKYIFGNPDANDLKRINNYLNSLDVRQQEDIFTLN